MLVAALVPSTASADAPDMVLRRLDSMREIGVLLGGVGYADDEARGGAGVAAEVLLRVGFFFSSLAGPSESNGKDIFEPDGRADAG